jgi:uncharacterized protein
VKEDDVPDVETRSTAEPVKIVLERRVRPGAKDPFEAWVRDVVATASRSGTLQGSSVLSRDDDYFVLLRFASQQDLARWQSSPEVTDLLTKGDALATSPSLAPCVKTGLETWFTVPGMPTPTHAPPRWKMALVTWLALMPLVIASGKVVPPEWPLLPKVALSTLIPVVALTWVVMPNLTRVLHGWLYGEPLKSRAG